MQNIKDFVAQLSLWQVPDLMRSRQKFAPIEEDKLIQFVSKKGKHDKYGYYYARSMHRFKAYSMKKERTVKRQGKVKNSLLKKGTTLADMAT